MDDSSVRSAESDQKCIAYRTFPGPPHIPHTLSIDFAASPKANGDATAEDVVFAGIEVGGCLVSASDGLWETRHGSIIPNTDRPQLCIDVHQVRPDPFNPNRSGMPKGQLWQWPLHAACCLQSSCTMPCLTHTNTSCQLKNGCIASQLQSFSFPVFATRLFCYMHCLLLPC